MSIVQCQRARPKSQAGFTLVELAIVMIIIGLLIGGVLKGQQLITNAQIAATVAQIKSIDAATTSFRDQYAAMPGDMGAVPGPATRIPNCTAANLCAVAGNGDGKVDTAAGGDITFAGVPAAGSEQLTYWAQLNSAGLITGVNPNAAGTAAWGQDRPASKISGGGYDAGYNSGAAVMTSGLYPLAAATSGEFLALHGTPTGGVTAAVPDAFMTPNNAARIDTKLDDGQPLSGSVLAAGNAAVCTVAAAGVTSYNESSGVAGCSLYIKFQN